MVRKNRIRRFVVMLTLYLAAAGSTGFFCVSAYNGSRGIVAKREYKLKIAKLAQDLAALQVERGDWERRISLMRVDALDLDILEERARLILNVAHKNDTILLLSDKP